MFIFENEAYGDELHYIAGWFTTLWEFAEELSDADR